MNIPIRYRNAQTSHIFWGVGMCAFLVLSDVHAQSTGKLNDTGVVLCANGTSNSVACSYADNDAEGFPRQDGQMGRSAKESASGAAALGKTGASAAAGFDYQKLAYTGGAVLAAGTAQGTTNLTWGCTKDVVTGLVWDMKVTTASNARLNSNTFNWKDSVAARNGGVSGDTGTATGTTCFSSNCDTESYIAYINTLNICGEAANDWRLPTRLELLSLIDVSKVNTGVVAVDGTYFPNLLSGRYWTRDNLASNPAWARWVDLATGLDGVGFKSDKNYVILVRP